MSVSFQPLLNGLLLTLEPEPEQSSIIQVQKSLVDLVRYGEITAIGPEVRDLKVGQRVLASVTAGVELAAGMLIPETAVLGILTIDETLHEG
jgi:hypothetical protein